MTLAQLNAAEANLIAWFGANGLPLQSSDTETEASDVLQGDGTYKTTNTRRDTIIVQNADASLKVTVSVEGTY